MRKRTVPLQCGLLMAAVFAFAAGTGFAEGPGPKVVLEPGAESSDGHVRVDWEPTHKGAVYEVQRAPDPDFEAARTIYHGPDLATFVSGLRNGTYYFRVRSSHSEWSETAVLHVDHHSLRLAFVLFTLGAIVFALTVFMVLHGTYLNKE